MATLEYEKKSELVKERIRAVLGRRRYPKPLTQHRRRKSLLEWVAVKYQIYVDWRCERARQYLDLHDPATQPQLEDIVPGMSEADKTRVLKRIVQVMHGSENGGLQEPARKY